jgi:3-deoxy-manno-octulosonate cytidylyltransferase (CMP-KDO synthetase)
MTALIGGVPLIARVTKQALKSKADRVYVVTDDERISIALKNIPIDIIMSDPSLPSGTDRVAFAAQNIDSDIIINVQGDEPFIPPTLIDAVITTLESDDAINAVSAYVPLDFSKAENPSHVKVVFDKDGFALYFSRSLIPYDRDNKLPAYYKHIGIYGFRKKYLLEYAKLPRSPLEEAEMLEQLRILENGGRIKMIPTDYTPISIDTPKDIELAVKYLNGKTYE